MCTFSRIHGVCPRYALLSSYRYALVTGIEPGPPETPGVPLSSKLPPRVIRGP